MQLAVLVQSLLYALELPLDHGMAEEHNRLGDDPDKPTIIVITVIFAVHQAVMGFAAGVVITHAKLGRMTTIGLVLAQSIALPVGALCDLATAGQLGATSAGRAVQGVLGALAAGSVAYVASTDLLHDQTAGASNYAPRLPHSLSLCAGFGLMTALAFFD
jgi:zinc transporter ZupT